MIVFALGLILILLSCGAETEDTPTPSFAIDRYAFAEKGYADITAPLPAGWDYSVIEETDDYGNEIFGIRFWPTAYPDLSVRIGWRPGIAVPGKTGAGIRETIPLSNGESLWRHSKRKGDDAQTVTVTWNGYPHMYIADYILPNALESEYEPIIRDIL